jgi:benzoylformate decarboxylase/acetolactate synthase-1/2/3 large subunit
VRAYKIMLTPPQEPVLISCDRELQEAPIHANNLSIPKVTLSVPPQADGKALQQAARWLVAANHPVIIADRVVRSQEGVRALVELPKHCSVRWSAPAIG